MNRVSIASLWKTHSREGWPRLAGPHEGELMTLDTVISGCVVFYLESPEGLDQSRLCIVQECLSDLDGLLPGLADESAPYFLRLRDLAQLLLMAQGPR